MTPHHPQRNTLIRAHATANVMRFHGTEADSAVPWPYEPTEPDGGWPTTRRFARSMYADSAAFQDDAAYADPVERVERHVVTLAEKCIYAVGASVLIAYIAGAFA